MPSLREIRSDLELLLQKSELSKDFRVQRRHLEFLINSYRSKGILETFQQTKQTDPAWVQDFGKVATTKVLSSDDPQITVGSLTLGKIEIPSLVSLPDDKGVYRIAGTSKQCTYYPISSAKFFELAPIICYGNYRANQHYHFRIGQSLYVHPYTAEINPQLILDNPLNGYQLRTHNVIELIPGESYTVSQGQIIHNSVSYNVNAIFTAVNPTFTGNGKVKFTNQKIDFTIDSPYPISLTLRDYIVLNILTKEFGIEPQTISDIKPNSRDESVEIQNRNR